MRVVPAPATPKPAISELELAQLVRWMGERGQPAYRARQVFHGLYRELAGSFEEMRTLPRELRAALEEAFSARQLARVTAADSPEDQARKLLLRLVDGATVEAVLIPQAWSRLRRAEPRFSGCLSSQAGCALACSFCATGAAGFERNLTAGEIVEQTLELAREARQRGGRLANLVFMGMGEPLANYEAVMAAVRRLNAPEAFGLGARHITISTSGLTPQIERLAGESLELGLALSLVAPTDELRSQLMPINRGHPLPEVLGACRAYAQRTGRRVTYEYVLLRGVNDTEECARGVAELLKSQLAHLNLIPFNPSPALPYQRSSPAATRAFGRIVEAAGVPVTVRHSLGGTVEGACGQLRAAYEAVRPGSSRRAVRSAL